MEYILKILLIISMISFTLSISYGRCFMISKTNSNMYGQIRMHEQENQNLVLESEIYGSPTNKINSFAFFDTDDCNLNQNYTLITTNIKDNNFKIENTEFSLLDDNLYSKSCGIIKDYESTSQIQACGKIQKYSTKYGLFFGLFLSLACVIFVINYFKNHKL